VEFMGYRRADGKFGVRNYLAVIPSVFCAKKVAGRIASQIPGTVFLDHVVGCSQVGEDLEQTARTLVNLAVHPNVGGVLIVGLGCERFRAEEFFERVEAMGKPVERVIIQEEGDTLQALNAGARLLSKLHDRIRDQRREPVDVSELTVGLECGGTDATSGIAANPAVGIASDLLIAEGGASIFSEVTELIGAEHILVRRCVTPEVAERLKAVIRTTEQELAVSTADPKYASRSALISTGNFQGGVTTVVEKALGNIHKTGQSPIRDVLEFAELVKGKGLFLMDTPGQDGESTTGLVAGGAQIVLFTTGRGTPTGFPTAPVIKITANPDTFERMALNIDVNAGPVLRAEATLEQMGKEIFELVVQVASGRKVKAEILGHDELLAIPRVLNNTRRCLF
jgi:altronate dehydratase large subunit